MTSESKCCHQHRWGIQNGALRLKQLADLPRTTVVEYCRLPNDRRAPAGSECSCINGPPASLARQNYRMYDVMFAFSGTLCRTRGDIPWTKT